MPEGGSSIFTDADGYQAALQDILDLVVLGPSDFHARLTWADLPNLRLLRARESSGRIGYMTLPADEVWITFPANAGSTLLCDGAALSFGDIMMHSQGERLHQRTTDVCEWGAIAVTPAALSSFGRILTEDQLVAPLHGQIVRPRHADGRRLERLHRQICRVVERDLGRIAHREVVHAFEQDLILALVACLADGTVWGNPRDQGQKSDALLAFEAMLTTEPHRRLRVQEVCASLGMSDAAFRTKCALGLGMSPGRYQRLRRLKRLRGELSRGTSHTKTTVEKIVIRHGFSSLARFVAEYWRVYGEMPPIHPRDPASKKRGGLPFLP